jgi:hypothetical protein
LRFHCRAVTSFGTLLTELPSSWLAPAVALGALVGALVARGMATALWRVGSFLHVCWGASSHSLETLREGAMLTLAGRLSVDAEERVRLRTAHGIFTLEGSLVVRENGRELPETRRRAWLARHPWVMVRGAYHRQMEHRDGEVYRAALRGHALVASGDGPVSLQRVLAPLPARVGRALSLGGLLLGGMAGVGLPARVVPKVLEAPPRAPRLRVRSIEPFRVVLERVPDTLDPTCPYRLQAPARWGIERTECEPTLTLVSPAPGLRSYIPQRLADPSPRARARSIALALGWPAFAAELAAVPDDVSAYRTAIGEAFAAGNYDAVWRFAREAPPAVYPSVAAEVVTTYLFTKRHEAGAADFVRAVAEAASPATGASLACIETFWDWPASRAPEEALAIAVHSSHLPACVILGATVARRGLDSLRTLEGLRRDDPLWRPIVDAAKNFVLLEGLASGTIRVPAPSSFEAFGDPDELRRSLNEGVAHLLDASARIVEERGYVRLAWQVRFPAQEAILRALIFDAPWYPDVRSLHERTVAARIEQLAEDYDRALEHFASARTRDRRLDDRALGRLREEALRFRREVQRLRAYRTALRRVDALPGGDEPADSEPLDVPAPTELVRAALRTRNPQAFAIAMGPPSIESLVTIATLGTHPESPCGLDPIVCAWGFDALRDPRAAAYPWRDRRLFRAFGHARTNFERRAESLEMQRAHGAPLHRYTARQNGDGSVRWDEPRQPAGAFVLAVAEALQRSIAR